MGGDSRERMLVSTTYLLGRLGLRGTSFREVIEHSGAPRGSIYHHFPGGKSQLVADAVRHISATGAVEAVDNGEHPVTVLWRVIRRWTELLTESDYAAGCPVVAIVADGFDGDDQLAAAVHDFFAMTELAVEFGLGQRGVEPGRAPRAARLLTASVEGAVMLARAQRSLAVLDDVGVELEAYLLALVPPPGGRTPGPSD